MPVTAEHEAPLELFRRYPELVPSLLRQVFHAPMPERVRVRDVPSTFNQVTVQELRSDGALVIEDESGTPLAGVIIEVQRQIDPEKLFSWPRYVAALHAQVRCATYLLVIALTDAVARWAAVPIPTFLPGSHWAPLVIGPQQVPRIESLDEAQSNPAYAVLSTLLHIHDEGGEALAFQAIYALYNSGTTRNEGLHMIWWLLGLLDGIVGMDRLQRIERYFMLNESKFQYEPKTPEFRAWFEKQQAIAQLEQLGEARGEARAILTVLSARKLAVTEQQRKQILDCTDLAALDRWVSRSAIIEQTEQLFDQP